MYDNGGRTAQSVANQNGNQRAPGSSPVTVVHFSHPQLVASVAPEPCLLAWKSMKISLSASRESTYQDSSGRISINKGKMWRNFVSLAIGSAPSEDSYQTTRMRRQV